MRYSVDEKVLFDVLNYVTTKPYREVAALLESVQKDMRPEEQKTATEPED